MAVTERIVDVVVGNGGVGGGAEAGDEWSPIVSGEIEITATGKFVGNLVQKDAQLTVAKGGLFKGQIIISENQDIFKIASDKPFVKPKIMDVVEERE